MLTPIEQMAESFHAAAPDQELPEHVKAAADCEPYQPWAVAHMHIAHNVSLPCRDWKGYMYSTFGITCNRRHTD